MNITANMAAFIASLYGNIYIYLVSRSMIIRIASYISPIHESFNSGSLTIKSIAIDCHGLSSVSGLFSYLYKRCLAALFHI